jgi:membrane-associated protease RseP (regulator of RpoE activity)
MCTEGNRGTDETTETISCAVTVAVSIWKRPLCARESSMPWRRFSAVFGPNPRSPDS